MTTRRFPWKRLGSGSIPVAVAWTLALVACGVAPDARRSGHGFAAQVCTQHTFLGNGPDEGNPGWHQEAQGLTHDADHWYATQNPSFFAVPIGGAIAGGPRLWRIPVTTDLSSSVGCGSGGVSCKDLIETPLLDAGYNHYGDLDFHEFDGRGYILIPIEGGDPGPGVAVFRADATLEFVAFAPVPGQSHWGWLAVDPGGILVSSEGGLVGEFRRYQVDWVHLRDAGELRISPLDFVVLQDETDGALALDSLQGGEFADDDGELLYVSNGFIGDQHPTWGVHVFHTRPGAGAECGAHGSSCVIARRIERSHDGSGGFAFEFDPTFDVYEETEGLTFWDLDLDGRAPGLRGQLHVILLDNDALSDDDVYVKHYRRGFGDPLAPEIVCPPTIAVECTSPSGVSAADPQLAPFFGGVRATDACDAAPSISNDAPPILPIGETAVIFTATDASSNSASCTSSIRVGDTTPATIDLVLSPALLWPPNHKLVPIAAAVTTADRCDPAVSFQLISITSNEPPEGIGDGTGAPDIQGASLGTADTGFALRAERSGTGRGRVYTIAYRAMDAAGNTSEATATVTVPQHR